MNDLRRAGVLWLVAAVLAIVVSIAYRFEMAAELQWAVLTIVAGIVAAVLGAALVWRGSTALVPWSSIAGVGWVVLYAVLALQQAYDVAAWGTDVVLAVFGGLAAVIAYRAPRQGSAL